MTGLQRTFFLVCLRCAWLPRAFPGIVAATCRRDVLSVESCCGCRSCSSWNPCPDWWWRPGCCTVATCRTDENFRWMLFAMSGLLTSNGQWPKLLFRLLCVPALLPLGQTPSSATTEAGVLLRPGPVQSRNFLLYVACSAFLTYFQWPAAENAAPASVCSCSSASSLLSLVTLVTLVSQM